MSTNTYHVRDGVAIEAECYAARVPQVQGTVIAGRNHYLVRKGGARVAIKVGDFIIRGENGEVDAMPPALFHQLFTTDADEVKAEAEAAKEVEAAAAVEAQAEADAQDEADAEVEAAADAVTEPAIDEPAVADLNIFEPTDDVPAAPEPARKPATKKRRRKKKI